MRSYSRAAFADANDIGIYVHRYNTSGQWQLRAMQVTQCNPAEAVLHGRNLRASEQEYLIDAEYVIDTGIVDKPFDCVLGVFRPHVCVDGSLRAREARFLSASEKLDLLVIMTMARKNKAGRFSKFASGSVCSSDMPPLLSLTSFCAQRSV